jgi:nitroimidazol reductase NimA-like FMN-containing flavoprotein (pyridoxamine 5'-phosphate oxidase superfamily)
MAEMTNDRNGLTILSRPECVEMLGTVPVGRIALSVGALPVVLPVNFAMLDDDVVIRTVAGSRLEAAATNAVVAFEADQVDPAAKGGWSVLVQGVASEITDPDELERARRMPLDPWSGVDGHYLRIATRFVSGRRLADHGQVGGPAGRCRLRAGHPDGRPDRQ